jgi:hypothetical protein
MSEFARRRLAARDAALDAWLHTNDPFRFRVALDLRVDALPRGGLAEPRPWADSYWPTYQDGINHRWQRTGRLLDDLSPAEKYDAVYNGWDPQRVKGLRPYPAVYGRFNDAFDPEYYERLGPLARDVSLRFGNARTRNAAAAGLLRYDGTARSGIAAEDFGGIEPWFGLCHAWAAAAILEPEPLQPVVRDGIRFEVSDIKALLIACYDRPNATLVGSRNDARDIDLDARGRARKADARDVNPGAFHVLLANLLGRDRRSFLEDRTATYEVWTQPIRGFHVVTLDAVSEAEAAELVQANGDYHFNERAARFFHVKTEVDYITESPPSRRPNGHDDDYERTDPYEYVLEATASGEIIGGEWVGTSRTEHPDFLWLPHGATRALSPFISLDEVRGLLQVSREAYEPDPRAISRSFSVRLDAGEVIYLEPLTVERAGRLELVMSGRGDVDAYARIGGRPVIEGVGDRGTFDLMMYEEGSNERDVLTVKRGDVVHVALRGFRDGSAATLRIVQMLR